MSSIAFNLHGTAFAEVAPIVPVGAESLNTHTLTFTNDDPGLLLQDLKTVFVSLSYEIERLEKLRAPAEANA